MNNSSDQRKDSKRKREEMDESAAQGSGEGDNPSAPAQRRRIRKVSKKSSSSGRVMMEDVGNTQQTRREGHGRHATPRIGAGLDQELRFADRNGDSYYEAKDWNHRSVNPHLDQVFLNNPPRHGAPQLHSSEIPFRRILPSNTPRVAYRRRRNEAKTVLHWGQRKLLLSEIEFLTLYASSSGKTVVYAGAAPGTHIKYLSELFPELTFHLWDPNDFTVVQTERIRLFQQYFTDQEAASYVGQNVLFISDIRTASPSTMSEDEVEKRVWWDMEQQQNWHLAMKPHRSMLKFRLPWSGERVEYLAGHVFLPIFGPQTTTEARLVPFGDEKTEWDSRKYEEQMFYFNTVIRNQVYPHSLMHEHSQGLDHCFDCTSEVFVLGAYASRHNIPMVPRGLLDVSPEERAASKPEDIDYGWSDDEDEKQDDCASGSSASPSPSPFTMAPASSSATSLSSPTSAPQQEPYTDADYKAVEAIPEDRRIRIVDMSREMSRVIARGNRTLADPQPPPGHRRLEKRDTPLQRTIQTHAPLSALKKGKPNSVD